MGPNSTDGCTQTIYLDFFIQHHHHSGSATSKGACWENPAPYPSTTALQAPITEPHNLLKTATMITTTISTKTYTPGSGRILEPS